MTPTDQSIWKSIWKNCPFCDSLSIDCGDVRICTGCEAKVDPGVWNTRPIEKGLDSARTENINLNLALIGAVEQINSLQTESIALIECLTALYIKVLDLYSAAWPEMRNASKLLNEIAAKITKEPAK